MLDKTFSEAVNSYLENGGEYKYLDKIKKYFEGKLLSEIVPFDIRHMALSLYPEETHSGATRNRCALTPTRAVILHAYDRGWCNLIRIKRFKQEKPKRKEPASTVWMYAFLRQCEKDKLHGLGALVLFMHQTAARISEAIRLEWAQVDLINRHILLLKTKTGTNSVRHLTDEMIGRLSNLPKNLDKPVFGYKSRFSINERIEAVCKRAGISYKSSHLVGRHSFATNAIKNGIDIKTAMDAGDWKSESIFLGIYVHSENASRTLADTFNKIRFDISV